MSFLRPSAAKQTTVTTATGTLTLAANSGDTRSLQTALGSGPVKCRYMLRGNGYFEMGRGTFTAPSTLTRDEVIISSNSDNLVNIPAGTTDVYLTDYGHFMPDKFSATSKTLTNKDGTNTLVFTGSSATVINLPASATCLPDFWNSFRNDGSANMTLTPNGSDTVEGAASLVICPGESGYFYLDGINWKVWRIPAFNSDGAIDLSGSVRKGIKFAATQNPSSDPNTLDDYEEGTATITDASGAGLSITNTLVTYTKTGRGVLLFCNLTYPSTGNTSPAALAGAPFASAANMNAPAAVHSNYVGGALISRIQGGSTNIDLLLAAGGGAVNNNVVSTGFYRFTINYHV